MSGAGTARGADAWDRSIRLWDAYFAVAWAATLTFVLAAPHPGWLVRAVAAGLLVPMVPWYVAVGRPLLPEGSPDERRALSYLTGAMMLYLPSAVLVSESRLLVFALIPSAS